MSNELKSALGIDSEGLTPYSRAYKTAMDKEPVPTGEQEKYLKMMGTEEPAALQKKVDIQKAGAAERQKLQDSPEYQQAMIAEFSPTQENASDLAKLFTLMTAMTFIGGGEGRYSGISAMNSLASAMEGYKKGKKETFEQELKNYDKYTKATIENNKRISDLLTKKLEAMKEGDQIASMQIDAELKARTGNQGALAGIEKMKSEQLVKTRDKIAELNKSWMEQQGRREDRALDRASRERSEMARIKLAEMRYGAAAQKAQKIPGDVEKPVRQNAVFLENIGDIVGKAESLIKGGQIRGIGVLQGKIPYDVAQLYMTKEERDFLQDFNALTNQKLKDQSGATVTGAEFARQRGVLPLRDDQPQVVLDKLNNWKRLVEQETSVIGRAYPEVIRKYGITLEIPQNKSKLVPGLEYRTPKGTMLWDGEQFLEPSGE